MQRLISPMHFSLHNTFGFMTQLRAYFEKEVRWKSVGMFRIEKLRKINKINQSRGLVKEEK